jgi:hypothetical protein
MHTAVPCTRTSRAHAYLHSIHTLPELAVLSDEAFGVTARSIRGVSSLAAEVLGLPQRHGEPQLQLADVRAALMATADGRAGRATVRACGSDARCAQRRDRRAAAVRAPTAAGGRNLRRADARSGRRGEARLRRAALARRRARRCGRPRLREPIERRSDGLDVGLEQHGVVVTCAAAGSVSYGTEAALALRCRRRGKPHLPG